ncbi:MAG TPA: phytanoyl-CoA dioxygenase family protein [Parvibaculum sp.]|jgi:ectoine hydroxylase-related dioxygenase (phytanoyl-CoA dioxygenase family)
MNKQDAEKHIAAVAEHGYTIVENAIAPDMIDALNEELLHLERKYNIVPAKNGFEGHNTVRIYNLLAHGKAFERIPVHENVLPVIEGVLDAECLISSLSSIAIDPGEIAQPIHADDQVMPVAKPHAPFVCNSMWALTDFTEENGATRIIPGTHMADNPVYGGTYDSIPAEMRKGSVLIWHGSLWHGGGANKSKARRVGIAMNYCAGYIRQQENQQLGLPIDLVKTFDPRLQELCGFGTYRALIGHIDKKTPSQRLLGETRDLKSIWDLAGG